VSSSELREYAEIPDRFADVPEGSSVTRFDDGRVCIIQGKTWASIAGVSVGPDEVDAVIEQTRSLVPPDKHCTWWLGPTVQPPDLVQQLRSRGFGVPPDGVAIVKALLLTRPPSAPAPGIEVHEIDTFEDFEAARQVQWEAFDIPEERRAQQRSHLRDDWEESQRLGVPVAFLATLEGEPASTGMAVPSDRGVFLIGGATAPRARGHGLYRSVVHARWLYAVERGTPAVVTQAVPDTSYPILKHLGFEDVCDVQRLEDSAR
jgi:hypothetical protein